MRLSHDQRRKQKLAERQRRVNRQQHQIDKQRLADAVHEAVCEHYQDDGLGHCADYAFAGAMLMMGLTKKSYIPQAGSLWVSGDPDDPTLYMAMLAENDGIYAGEFHAWIVGPVDGRQTGVVPDEMEIIDLSARHFGRWVERPIHCVSRESVSGGQIALFEPVAEQQRYLRPVLPFLWCRWIDKPDWIKYQADEKASKLLWEGWEHFHAVSRLAMGKYTNRKNYFAMRKM